MYISPCPFCNSKEVEPWVVENGGDCPKKGFKDIWAVGCDDCNAEGPWIDSKEGAITAWNTRILNDSKR